MPRDTLLEANIEGLRMRAAQGDRTAQSQLADSERGVAASAQQHWGEREGLKEAAEEDRLEQEEEKHTARKAAE
jgi:hypothetical protein